MDNLSDIKKIWLTTNTSILPNTNEMLLLIKSYRKKMLAKKITVVTIAVLLAVLMCVIMFLYHSALLATRIGEVCMLVACIILIASNINSLQRAYKLKNFTNKEFIEYLEQGNAGRIRYYKKTQVVGFSFVSIGLLLYLFEGVYKNTVVCIVSYSILVIWLWVNWFIIRPKAYKRQTKKMNDTLKKIETISKQF
jgi:hypothetical protein